MTLSTKTCSNCKLTFPISDYQKSKRYTSGFHPECKICRNNRGRKHYKKIMTDALRIYNFKCQNCGNGDIVVLQFHHIKGQDKLYTRGQTTFRYIIKKNRMVSEIELLCANCHVHADIRDGTSAKFEVRKEIQEEIKNY